jgi:nucleoid DNA-binding protein
MAKTAAPAGKSPTKSEIYSSIAEKTGLTRKQVASVFEELTGLIKNSLNKKGPGVFTLPGLAKLHVKVKPATKERMAEDRFTKQMRLFKAKPATRVVKIRALKNLKELVK